MTAPDFWPAAKRHLSKADPVMKKLITKYKTEMLTTRSDAFYTLARSITGQQISVKAADSVWKKLETAAKRITPAHVLKLTEPELRACGLSQQKVRYLRAVAEHFTTNAKHVKKWNTISDDELLKELISLPGIGRWTAEMFLIFHMLRPDVLPIGDLGLVNAIARHYNNGVKLTKPELLKLSEKWAPYRTVATWYLWRALDPEPILY